MTAREARLWSGRPTGLREDDLPAGLRVWLSVEGYPLSTRTPDDEPVLLASTSDSPDAADVPAGTPSTAPSPSDLLTLVPAGYGLLVDGGTPGRHVVPAQRLDAARSGAAPDGTEPDLVIGPVPSVHRAAADAAVEAGRAAGVKRVVALWASGGGRTGLWVSLHRPSEAALDAVHAAVAQASLAAPARVLDVASLSARAQEALYQGMARSEPEQVSGRLLNGRQELVVLAGTLLGAVLLVLGRRADAAGLQAAGLVLLVLVVTGSLLSARGTGRRDRPLVLAGGAVVAGLLVWQAARALA